MTCRRACVAWLAAAVGIALAGCGGQGEQSLYDLNPTRSCLRKADLQPTTKRLDFVASTAIGGAVRVRFPDNDLTLTFGDSEREAERIERAYRRFAPKRYPIQDVLRRDRNVVMLWGVAPTIDQLDTVSRCLQS
jgi:hypothetical protein